MPDGTSSLGQIFDLPQVISSAQSMYEIIRPAKKRNIPPPRASFCTF